MALDNNKQKKMQQLDERDAIEEEMNWLFRSVVNSIRLFGHVIAVSNYAKENALRKYGDYFGFSQQVMQKQLLLELAKLYVKNRDSHTLPRLVERSLKFLTKKNFKNYKLIPNENRSLDELKQQLLDLHKELEKLGTPINNLKKVRDNILAHNDKSISNALESIAFQHQNPITAKEVKRLVEFGEEIINTLSIVLFNKELKLIRKDYNQEIKRLVEDINGD
ncbi:hypothetical protein LQZ24_04795 [Fructobacillus sp. M1-13]|uniref:HEPN AbiU2-like domain-containing protein n=1 Tax=Fructobacillus papyriferae TaxID=2713171 RepID=A0ABS5QQV1_9LACO|nr:hypothetical protein [Fructobacillus papyriferae]MBS9335573.1 hypothetical protein [Fructobacillus papyriferae]MCD2159337.1 hypothetical protein [Fructobacillus papyriferae]